MTDDRPSLTLKAIQDDKDYLSETLGKGLRMGALAVFGGLWAMLSADGLTLAKTTLLGLSTSYAVTAAFSFGAAVLLFDGLQYAAGYWKDHLLLRRLEAFRRANGSEPAWTISRQTVGGWVMFLHWGRLWLFTVKIACGLFALLMFVAAATATEV